MLFEGSSTVFMFERPRHIMRNSPFQLLEEVVVDQICFNSGCISKLMLCNTDPLLTLIAGVKSTPTPHP